MKYYAISDIHGFYNEMIEALNEKGFFSDTGPHKLVICGDLLDRGAQINEIIDFVLELMKKDEVILIKGNHEDLLIDLAENIYRYLPDPSVYHHGSNGTFKTALALARMRKTDVEIYPEAFTSRVLNSTFVKKIVNKMVDYYETDNYIFVHGWIPCHEYRVRGRDATYSKRSGDWRKSTEKEWESARWYNGMAACHFGVREENKTIVCGHYTASWGHNVFEGNSDDFSPYYNEGIIAIDGSTSYTHKVNCIVIED